MAHAKIARKTRLFGRLNCCRHIECASISLATPFIDDEVYSGAIQLTVYPTMKVTVVPIITHQVQGKCVPSHK